MRVFVVRDGEAIGRIKQKTKEKKAPVCFHWVSSTFCCFYHNMRKAPGVNVKDIGAPSASALLTRKKASALCLCRERKVRPWKVKKHLTEHESNLFLQLFAQAGVSSIKWFNRVLDNSNTSLRRRIYSNLFAYVWQLWELSQKHFLKKQRSMQIVLSSTFLSYRKFQCIGGYVYSMIVNGNFHFILGFTIYVFHSIYLQHVR